MVLFDFLWFVCSKKIEYVLHAFIWSEEADVPRRQIILRVFVHIGSGPTSAKRDFSLSMRVGVRRAGTYAGNALWCQEMSHSPQAWRTL